MRAAMREGPEYYATANDEVLCLPMVETRQAVESLDEILSVPGMDGVFVGPNDLALSYGLQPGADQSDETFGAAIDAIVAGCRSHGLVAGCAGTAETAPKRLAQGFLFVEVSRDSGSMLSASRRHLQGVRNRLEGGQA